MASNKRKDNLGRNLRQGESQRPNGSFEFKYSVGGKRRSITRKTLPELRDAEEKIQRDIFDGINAVDADSMTINDCFDRYISNKSRIKKSVKAHYQLMYTTHVRNGFGEKLASKIRYSDVLQFYNELMNVDKLQIGSIRYINTFLKPTFQMAVRDGIIRFNPCDGAIKEIASHSDKPQKRRALTQEQQAAFMNFIRLHPIYKKYLPLFTVLVGTGMRINECLGLTWSDVSFKDGTISVNHSLSYKVMVENGCYEHHITTTKTAAGTRLIPMLPEVRKVLLELKEYQMSDGLDSVKIDGYSGFVFQAKTHQVYAAANIHALITSIIKAYNELETQQAAEAGREPTLLPKFSAHTFRHCFATRLVEQGVDVKTLQTVMGHEKITTTLEIYADCTADTIKSAFEQLDDKTLIG